MSISGSFHSDLIPPNSDFINVAALCPDTAVLGPGRRFVVWVQGCCFDCPRCISPAWRVQEPAKLFTVDELTHAMLRTADLEGLTISGGEPMLQAANLHRVITAVRQKRNISVICYTGFTLEDLRGTKDSGFLSLLSDIDVLIDGPYIERLNDNRGLRGSSNQRVNFLTGVYQDQKENFTDATRNLEAHLFDDHYLMVGIHPKNFKKHHEKEFCT